LALGELRIDPSVSVHSIIADPRDPPAAGGSDGIVPYSSSHLEGAASELLVHGQHICLSQPAVIEEVRRILREHAGLGRINGSNSEVRRNLESHPQLVEKGADHARVL
jgi:hypothetical protein